MTSPGADCVSVVIPIYNEKEVLPRLLARLEQLRTALDAAVEVVFVNDGSSDGSLELLKRAAASRDWIRLVDLSRNFGHQAALTAGLDHARGDAVVTMDGDLQDPPELIAAMLERYREGYDVVYARRRSRAGEGLFKRGTARLFYRVMRAFVHADLPVDVGDFRLMSRRAVAALSVFGERNRFLRGLVCWIGFRQTAVEFDRPARAAGETKYPLRRMLRLALDAMFSFSSRPLRLSMALGGVVLAFGVVYGGVTVWRALAGTIETPGFATLVVLNALVGGSILVCLGCLGEYVGRIFDETKRRPLYIARELVNFGPASAPAARAGGVAGARAGGRPLDGDAAW
jgi:dolichol-phosphate mannosyltransferase